MKESARIAHLRQLCCLGLAPQQVVPRLLQAVREIVSAESAGFFWLNGAGEMQNLYAERRLAPESMERFFHVHYDGTETPFRQGLLARLNNPVSVSVTSPDANTLRSHYYNEVLRELDAYHVLHAIVRDTSSLVGQLSLYRAHSQAAFSQGERARIASITHYLAHALNLAVKPRGQNLGFSDTEDEAFLVIGTEGTAARASHSARSLLALAGHETFSRTAPMHDAEARMRARLIDLKRTLEAIASGAHNGPPPRIQIHNAWGRFILRAYLLDEAAANPAGEFGVLITRQEPVLLRLAESLKRWPISPQQREVALLVAQGKSNRDIADKLCVSLNTASYHTKQLFAKLEVHGREEVIRRLFEGPDGRPGQDAEPA